MSKKILFIFIITLFFVKQVFSQDNSSTFPPVISKVETLPQNVTAKDEVKIKAFVFNEPKLTDDITLEVALFYSLDEGKTFTKLDLSQNENDDTLWEGSILPQKEGTKVIYYLSAKDTAGNSSSEIAKEILEKEQDKKNENFWLPEDNELTLVLDVPLEKETGALKIIKIYASYNKDYFYLKEEFNNPPPNGPQDDFFYAIDVYNIDNGDISSGQYDIGCLTFFRPTMALFPGGVPTRGLLCSPGMRYKADEVLASPPLDMVIKGNSIYWRWKRKDQLNNPQKVMKLQFNVSTGKYEGDKVGFWPAQRIERKVVYLYLGGHQFEVGK